MYSRLGSLFHNNPFQQQLQDPQYITSSNSSSLESITNVPAQYGNDQYMVNEPPGFSKYRIGAIQG